MQNKWILVTGGAGFIGSHLCRRLLTDGFRVRCLDNFSTGSEENLKALSGNPDFELVRGDVIQPYDAAAGDASFLVLLACPASPVHYLTDPVHTLRTSIEGTLNGLEIARKRNIPLLLASTSEVYGDPLIHPQPETYRGNVNPCGPRACYDEGKRSAETLCFDYRRKYGTCVKVLRFFNTYGPRMRPDDGRVVSNFILQALHGADLTVYGDGSQTRSFCYISDLVEGIVRMMKTPDFVTGPVNLGNSGEFTVKQLAELVIAQTGSCSGIEYLPLPEDDPTRRRPDISLANELLHWKPRIPLEQGLAETIAFFRGNTAGE